LGSLYPEIRNGETKRRLVKEKGKLFAENSALPGQLVQFQRGRTSIVKADLIISSDGFFSYRRISSKKSRNLSEK